MNADDRDESAVPGDEKSSAGESQAKSHDPAEQGPGMGADVISTSAPILSAGTGRGAGGQQQPASTLTVETSRVSEVASGTAPGIMIVPFQENSPSKPPSRQQVDPPGRSPAPDRKGQESRRRPSMMHSLLLPGLVALVCGIVGALGYSYFFGPSKSDDQGASARKSDSSKPPPSSSKEGSEPGPGGRGGAGSNSSSAAGTFARSGGVRIAASRPD
jgi:hypothetical protein